MYELKNLDRLLATSQEDIIYHPDQQAWLVIGDSWYVDVDKVFTVTFVPAN
jgi:hypothetical protein